METSRCKNCNEELSVGKNKCSKCGKAVKKYSDIEMNTETGEYDYGKVNARLMKKWLPIIIIAFLILSLIQYLL